MDLKESRMAEQMALKMAMQVAEKKVRMTGDCLVASTESLKVGMRERMLDLQMADLTAEMKVGMMAGKDWSSVD